MAPVSALLWVSIDDATDNRFESREAMLAMLHRQRSLINPVVEACGGCLINRLGSAFVFGFADDLNALKGARKLRDQLCSFNASQQDEDRKVNFKMVLLEATDEASRRAADIEAVMPGQTIAFTDWFLRSVEANSWQHSSAIALTTATATPQTATYYLLEAASEDQAFSEDVFSGLPEQQDDELPEFDWQPNQEPDRDLPQPVSPQQPAEEDKPLELDERPEVQSPSMVARQYSGHHQRLQEKQQRQQMNRRLFQALSVVIVLSISVILYFAYFKPKSGDRDLPTEATGKTSLIKEIEKWQQPNKSSRQKDERLRRGTIRVIVEPAEATVIFGGRVIGNKTPLKISKVPFDSYNMVVHKPGFRTYETLFNLDESYKEIRVILRPDSK